jgi:hypothetical protein
MTTHTASAALLARLSDADLLDQGDALRAKPAMSTEDRMVAAWLSTEFEARHPEVLPVLDAILDADDTVCYGVALRQAWAEVTVGA